MDESSSENELTRKLVSTWHLTSHERRALPGEKVRGSLIYESIVDSLESHGRFPIDWQPDDSFSGGVIEAREDGTYRVTWKAELSMMHYEAVSIQDFDSRQTAVESFAKAFFGGDIDGIPIDWSA